QINAHAERFEHVCRTAQRTRRAIAVFRNSRIRGSRNNRRRRRNIECLRAVTASSARIHHVCWRRFTFGKHTRRIPPHHSRNPSKLHRTIRSRVQRRQQPHHVWRLEPPREQLFHQRFRFISL